MRKSKAAGGHGDHWCLSPGQSPFLTISLSFFQTSHFSIRVAFSTVQYQQAKWSILYMVLRWLFSHKALILNNNTVFFLKQGFLFSEPQVLFSLVYMVIPSNKFTQATHKNFQMIVFFIEYISHGLTNHTRSTHSHTHTHSSQRRKRYSRCLQCLILSNNSVSKTEK